VTCDPVANGNVSCQNGQCAITCFTGFTQCGNACLNAESDPNHCGSCGNQCRFSSEVCSTSGQCVGGICELRGATSQCNHQGCSGGVETFYVCDGAGSCGTTLHQRVCPNGCDPWGEVCGNCGSHTDCGNDRWCDVGICQPKRANGEDCVDTDECLSGHCVKNVCCNSDCLASVANGSATCGNWNTSHPGKGTCVVTCAPGWGNCDGNASTGCEADLNTSEQCGACGSPCPPDTCRVGRDFGTFQCIGGVCECWVPEVDLGG
jgi:hypothetical protein